ncbi:DNA ligase [Sulfurospirillum sp. 1307]|jgi:DNA ligase-1
MIRFFILFIPFLLFASKPSLLLLKTYKDQNISGWLMSEKLDGIRAYWDGKKLLSRSGKKFSVPIWFIKNFPSFEIDGELWSKRGDFENISSITSKKIPHDGWKQITYNIFEVPNQKGGLKKRLKVLEDYLIVHPNKYIKIIKQTTCKDKKHLKSFLKEVENKGGEGVVIRDPNAPYIDKRTSKVLKVKSFKDTECKIIAINQGKGKYLHVMGSLTCKLDNGKEFKIGSGFSDEQRKNPPKIGSIITFKYKEFTKYGKPRFPVFLRVRDER